MLCSLSNSLSARLLLLLCRLITYHGPRAQCSRISGAEFRKISKRASPVNSHWGSIEDAARDGPYAHGNVQQTLKFAGLRAPLSSLRLSLKPGGTRQFEINYYFIIFRNILGLKS